MKELDQGHISCCNCMSGLKKNVQKNFLIDLLYI